MNGLATGRLRFPRAAQKAGPVFVANMVTRASSTLALIVVARLSGPADAGALSLATGYLAILTTLFIGLDDVVIREIATHPRRTPWLVGSYAVLRVPLTVISCAVALAFMARSPATPSQALAMQLIVASALLDILSGLGQAVLLGLGHPEHLVVPAVLLLALRAGAGALLMAAAGIVAMSVMWPLAALLAGLLLVWSAVVTVRARGIGGRTRFVGRAARALAVLLPGFGAVSLLSALEYQVDVILLSVLRGPVEVGIYSSAASIMYIAALVPQAYRATIFPEFAQKRDKPRELAVAVRRATLRMWLLGLVIAGAGALIAPLVIPLIFGPKFVLAAPVIRVLIWNIVFMCVNVPLVRYLMATGQERYVWRTLMLSTTVNAAVNIILIPPYGATGAAWARLASSALFTGVVGVIARRRMRQTAADMEVADER
jgi:O-antigen/teichoic acid export membrane protein